MKVSFQADGKLVIEAENYTEDFALKAWAADAYITAALLIKGFSEEDKED